MKGLITFCFIVAAVCLAGRPTRGADPVCFSLTPSVLTYSQNFNSLPPQGSTSAATPIGWGFVETGTNADGLMAGGTGSSATGNTYSAGRSAPDPDPGDRAIGGLRSGTLVPTHGGCFTNNTGETLQSVTVSYDGEQWRLGATGGRTDRLDFQYSLNATSLLTGAWTDVDALDFVTPRPFESGTGANNGNDPFYRTPNIQGSLGTVSIGDGQTLYIRFVDFDASGSDDLLAVDNFSLAVAATPTSANVYVGGRVLTADGRGIAGARMVIEGGDLEVPMVATTNPFGYFRFDGLQAGETYFVTAASKRFAFAEPTRSVTPVEDIADLTFVASQ